MSAGFCSCQPSSSAGLVASYCASHFGWRVTRSILVPHELGECFTLWVPDDEYVERNELRQARWMFAEAYAAERASCEGQQMWPSDLRLGF